MVPNILVLHYTTCAFSQDGKIRTNLLEFISFILNNKTAEAGWNKGNKNISRNYCKNKTYLISLGKLPSLREWNLWGLGAGFLNVRRYY